VLVERAALLDRLAGFPLRLAEVAGRVAAAEAAAGPPPGEWTPRDVVAHLVAVEGVVWHSRLDDLARNAGEPHWSWTEPGPVTDPAAATLNGALAVFATARSETAARVAAFDDAGWARTGVHATYGRLDVAALLRLAADHDDEHLAALEARAAG
jgi:hypothetical protein